MTAHVIHLPGVILPETGPLRDHVRPPARRSPLYLERFDRRTLIYDAVERPQGGVLLTAPRLLNLWPLLRDGLRLGDVPLPRRAIRRHKSLRFEQITIPSPGERMRIEIAGGAQPLPLRPSGAPLLADRRVVMAVNKDNHPSWICDWARFHARRHGADGVLVFDNGSRSYTPQDLADDLAAVPGIARAVIVSAPFPYGPADKGGRFDVPPRFFQTAMFNLARRDFLVQARSALSVDIDELVAGPDGDSIFEATERHPLGMITLPGHWAFPAPDTQGPAAQRDHIWQADPPQPCHQKWCINPRGPMGRVAWNVHKLGGPLQPLFTMSDRFSLLHCRACSTGWKPGRFAPPDAVTKDMGTQALFADAFGGPN
ncbi:MAG: hypothetical protein OIF40_11240 [Mangrovicoccus sp.]|nr:hypothetical protein [Mangrovicoccus sp.]